MGQVRVRGKFGRVGALVVAGQLVTSAASAQQVSRSDSDVRGRVDVHVGLTGLQGSAAPFAGAAALLGLGSRLWLGGAGYASGRVEYSDRSSTNASLGVGYGGLVLEVEVWEGPAGTVTASVLAGGGNADVTDPVVGVELGSDNFIVIAPALSLRHRLAGPLAVGAEAGYRLALGVQDLPGTNRRRISGATVSVVLHVMRR